MMSLEPWVLVEKADTSKDGMEVKLRSCSPKEQPYLCRPNTRWIDYKLIVKAK